VRSRPAHEDSERVIGWRTRSGRVGQKEKSSVGGEVHCFVAEVEVADDGVVDDLDAGAVLADVVGCPQRAERFATGGEFADEVGKGAVVGNPAGLGAQESWLQPDSRRAAEATATPGRP
jgi:hypothetical protein